MPEIPEKFDKHPNHENDHVTCTDKHFGELTFMNAREDLMHKWLRHDLGYSSYKLTTASVDASFRHYFRLVTDSQSFIVMDAPPAQEDCRPFMDIASRLLGGGLNVPEVLASDLEKGFLLLSDLGKSLYLDQLSEANAERLYGDALKALLLMQRAVSPDGLPGYDEALLQTEMDLFHDWLLVRHLDLPLDQQERNGFKAICQLLRDNALQQPRVFVHRDYHSRNLMVSGENNPGILDFQDAVRGPITYDLVSLLKDCYIKWPSDWIYGWVDHFYEGLNNSSFGREEFITWFDLMGVQRHLKASGIFARLWHRDGKPGYLKDIPRTLSYIIDLENKHTELGPLVRLIRQRVLPALAGEEKPCGP